MSKVVWPGSTLLSPVPPVLVSCGSAERPNAITIAWTGILNSHPPMTYISVRPERFSHGLIKARGEFIIHLPTAPMARAIDYCGCRSGREEDKFSSMGFTPYRVEGFDCPAIDEFPIALACRVTDTAVLGCHEMFLAEIKRVLVDDRLLNPDGKLCIERAELMAYAHGQYFRLGESLGSFGFSVKKPRKKGRG